MGLTDSEIENCIAFREKGRLPVMCYVLGENETTKATLWRSSQCKSGLTSYRSPEDEKMIKYIAQITNSKNGVIYDARSYLNAVANKFNGKGFHNESNYIDTTVQFGDIPNIHSVKSAHKNLLDQVQDGTIITNDAASWNGILQKILIGATKIVNIMKNGTFVIINCSDGWDRTPQLISLVKIILDPYYRTFPGFRTLIDVEWIAFSHKFSSRLKMSSSNDSSPIFIQFLDSVRLIMNQNQECFQFNDLYLKDLAEAYVDGRFCGFIHDSLADLAKGQKEHSLLSVWDWLFCLRRYHENPFYEKLMSEKKRVLVVECHQYCIDVWNEFHRGELGYCLGLTAFDKKVKDKKLRNQLVMSRLRGDEKHGMLVGLCDYDNFVKL